MNTYNIISQVNKRLPVAAITISLVLTASPALALDMEFYTYGGFKPIVQAFTKIALIFSDAGYQGLFFVIMVLGLVAGVTGWLARAATGARVVPLVWAVPVFIGAILYLALFVPKGNITVYDPVLNRFRTIGEIPDAVVFTAGFLNRIERGMVDIIDTAAAPNTDYRTTAGGIGFQVLESVRGSLPKNDFMRTSMIRYVRDCVSFELTRPGTTLTLDDLRNNTTDFLTDLGKAINPSVYTVYYDAAAPEGITVTCSEAWNRLRPLYASPGNYDEAIRKVCSKASFDPASTIEMNTCKSLFAGTLAFTTGGAVTPERIIRQRQIAEILYSFYFREDPETAALMESDKRITASGLGVGLTMNEWIPIIRAIMSAIAIGVIPFLALFLPTPIVGKALSVMFGFFVFLTTWGITDAVIHGAAMDYASYGFEEMRQSNLGVFAMAALPTISLKMLSMFGVIRSAGIMLASFFSMMLIRFGGHALAMLAGNLSRVVQSAGAQAGRHFTPEGTGAAMNEQIQAAGLLEGLPEHRFSNMAAAGAFALHRQVGGYMAAMNTERALERSGQIPAGTSSAEMATMMASARMSAGTPSGPVEVSTTTDGKTTRIKSETVNPDGSTTVLIIGSGSTGTATDTLGAGSASYSVDADGRKILTRATVNGLNPVTVGTMAQHQRIVSAANSLGSSQTWQQAMDTARKASLTSSEARGFTNRLDNAMRENWARAISDKSSFVHSMSESTRNMLTASISSGHLPLLRRIGGHAQLVTTGENGEKVSFNVSEDVARRFENTASRVRSESLQQTLQDAKSLDYMTRLAKQIGATEVYTYLRDARELRSSTESYGADLTTALVNDYAVNRYGSPSPENIRKTIAEFNQYLSRQGPQGVDDMHEIIKGFVSGHGYGWGDTTSAVNKAMAANRSRSQGPEHFKHDIAEATLTAGSRTFGVNEGNFSAPSPDQPLDNPSPRTVIDPADAIRERNRVEESGKGGIKTTAGGMAKEMVGADAHQPISPTSDLFRNDAFYNEGSLVEPRQRADNGIVLPSGMVIRDGEGHPTVEDKDFFKGSVFEKK